MGILDLFYFACNAVLPIVILVIFGYILKRLNVFSDSFLNTANSLVFRIFLPVLLFSNIGFIDQASFLNINWNVVIFSVISIILLFFLGLIIVLLFVKDNKQKGVILQSVFRSNYAIIGIPLCEFLTVNMDSSSSSVAIGLATIVAAFSVPLFNSLGVIALSVFDKEENTKINIKDLLKKIAKNPLILGVVSGLLFLGIRMIFIELGIDLSVSNMSSNFLYKAVKNIASIASPLALIVLGGRFKFSSVKRLAPQIVLGTALRTVIVPLIFLMVGYLLGFRTLEFPTLIALFATPAAVSSASMAREMNQDSELADQLVVWTSIISIFTISFIFSIF